MNTVLKKLAIVLLSSLLIVSSLSSTAFAIGDTSSSKTTKQNINERKSKLPT